MIQEIILHETTQAQHANTVNPYTNKIIEFYIYFFSPFFYFILVVSFSEFSRILQMTRLKMKKRNKDKQLKAINVEGHRLRPLVIIGLVEITIFVFVLIILYFS